jgi:hypothetical protein
MSPDHLGHRHLSGDKLHITYSCFYTHVEPTADVVISLNHSVSRKQRKGTFPWRHKAIRFNFLPTAHFYLIILE